MKDIAKETLAKVRGEKSETMIKRKKNKKKRIKKENKKREKMKRSEKYVATSRLPSNSFDHYQKFFEIHLLRTSLLLRLPS